MNRLRIAQIVLWGSTLQQHQVASNALLHVWLVMHLNIVLIVFMRSILTMVPVWIVCTLVQLVGMHLFVHRVLMATTTIMVDVWVVHMSV